MEKRIFGLLPVVGSDGLLLEGVTRIDVTGVDQWDHDGRTIDAPEAIPCGSMQANGTPMQAAVARGVW